jgi:hypothetical protein
LWLWNELNKNMPKSADCLATSGQKKRTDQDQGAAPRQGSGNHQLRKMKANKFAIGSRLGKGAFNHWLVEQLSGLNVNVRYVHTKYMLVDPSGPTRW